MMFRPLLHTRQRRLCTWQAALVFFTVSTFATAQTPPPNDSTNTAVAAKAETATTPPVSLPESFARQQMNSFAKPRAERTGTPTAPVRADALKLPPRPIDNDRPAAENIQKLDEIRVFSRVNPEDYVAPKRPPMLAFRDSLDRQRPSTPAEKAQLALCIIGLCGVYGPEGVPVDSGAAYRQEARKNNTDMLSIGRPIGTLQ
jgi:hypothetical protein